MANIGLSLRKKGCGFDLQHLHNKVSYMELRYETIKSFQTKF